MNVLAAPRLFHDGLEIPLLEIMSLLSVRQVFDHIKKPRKEIRWSALPRARQAPVFDELQALDLR